MKITITAQSGHQWEEEVEDVKSAIENILKEHADILSITDEEMSTLYHM